MSTITATPNTVTGSVDLEITQTSAVTAITRSNVNGISSVRVAAGQLPSAATGTTIVTDYEAAQGVNSYTAYVTDVTTRTNLATNPSFETASGTVNVRTNLYNQSTILIGAGASQTAGVTFSGSTWTRLSTTTAGHGLRALTNLADLVNGAIYEAEWELANDGAAAVSVALDWCDSARTVFTLAAGERRRCKVTGVTGITYNDTYRFSDLELQAANTSILFREILIEKDRIQGPYFDGSTTAAGDFTYAWSSGASHQQAPGVVDVSMVTSLAVAYQSKTNATSGTKSLRITAQASHTDTFAGLWGAANSYVWKANTTYTIAGDRTIVAPQTGASGAAFRVNIGTELNVTLKTPITNTAGTQRVVGTFTTGTGTGLNFLRLYNGAPAGGGDVWWDNVIVEEGDTGGAYFDGSTPDITDVDYSWTGTANASTSKQTTTTRQVTATATLTIDKPWLLVPIAPNYSEQLEAVTDYSAGRETFSTVHRIIGRADPLVVMGKLGTRTGTLELWAENLTDVNRLARVFDRGEAVLLKQTVPGMDMYFAATSLDVSPYSVEGANTRYRFSVQYQEVTRPSGNLAGALGWTFDALAADYPSFDAVTAAFANFDDLTLGDTL